MWNHEPNAQQIAQWFSTQPLHEGMKHEHYVPGIIAIPNDKKTQWKPYINAPTRVMYFWDWCDANADSGEIDVGPPVTRSVEIPGVDGKPAHVHLLSVRATVIVNGSRKASGSKQVRNITAGWHPTQRGVKVMTADPDALMKAETGAVARALGMLGMLTLPTSGIATAEDIFDTQKDLPDNGQQQKQPEKRPTRAAPNPKQ